MTSKFKSQKINLPMRHLLMIAFTLLTMSNLEAQSNSDCVVNQYSEKLIGTWLRQNQVVDGREKLQDTTVIVSDTLIFSNTNYYSCQGSNLERNWLGIIEHGTWDLNLNDTVVYINFHQKYSNLRLPLTNYTNSIIKITKTEFVFLYYNRTFVYRRIK